MGSSLSCIQAIIYDRDFPRFPRPDDFPVINICKVPREVLKTVGEARGFQPSGGALRMLMTKSCLITIIA